MESDAEGGLTLRRYLLDEMPPDAREGLEERYLGDEELFDRLREAEDRLVRDYWAGRLSPPERRRFEEHYLASPARRQRAALVRMLMDRATRPREDARPGTVRPAGSVLSGWARAAVWTGALLGASVLAVRQWPTACRPGSPETPTVTSPPSARRLPPGARDDVAWQRLAPGRRRSAAGLVRVPAPAGPAPLRLRLELPTTGARRYVLTLETPEGREVWRSATLEGEGPGSSTLFVEIPSATPVLEAGDYVLFLRETGGDGGGDAEYFFRVAPP